MDSPSNRAGMPADHAGTFFDSFDGWAQLIRQTTTEDRDPSIGTATPSPFEAADVSPLPAEAAPWRPTRRPPMSLLHVVDDGRDTGETIRLRDDRLVIGRTTGPVAIDHDPFLADHHAQLDRLPGEGWLLTDLGSRDGTWVRVTTARLRHGTRIQFGATRLRFQLPHDPLAVNPLAAGAGAVFVVEGPDGDGEAHPCPAAPFLVCRSGVISAGEGMATVPIDDPFVSPIHAEVIVGRRGGWRIVNRGLNGLWVRLDAPLRLGATAQFQCGDQRFVLEQTVAQIPSATG